MTCFLEYSNYTKIGNEGSRQQHISRQVDIVLAQLLGNFSPASLLATQATNQLGGSVQLLGAQVHITLQLLLLILQDKRRCYVWPFDIFNSHCRIVTQQ